VRVRGLASKLDPAKVPNLNKVQKLFRLPEDMGSCLFSFSSGIVYNKNKFAELGLPPPTRWQDLASPKLSGHVGTQTLAATPVKYFLAAYAIQLGDTPTKWDRAIDEVAKIKFQSFSAGIADLMAKIEAGDVWAAPIVGSRAYALIEKGLPVEYVLPENGNGTKGGISCTPIVVPKGSTNAALGEKMLNFALSPDAQLMQATAISAYGPVISTLDPILEKAPKIADRIPWGKVVTNGFRLSWDSEADLDRFSEYVEAWNRKVQK
jgi:putative spermidine/putrescine transport system substrate-binding protein